MIVNFLHKLSFIRIALIFLKYVFILVTEILHVDIDLVIAKVQTSMQRVDEDIRKDIRFYSKQRAKATNSFKASQISIAV